MSVQPLTYTLEISRPNTFVLTQSEDTKKMLRRLIWLYVSKPFHITPALARALATMKSTKQNLDSRCRALIITWSHCLVSSEQTAPLYFLCRFI